MKKYINNKAQVMLETVVSFVAMFAFLLGIVNLWVWSDAQTVGRQTAYNDTRVQAGTATEGEDNDKSLYTNTYTPLSLDEGLVIGK